MTPTNDPTTFVGSFVEFFRPFIGSFLGSSIISFSESFIRTLCRYRKRTDIYYSTWSFENVAKSCQFKFLDPPQNCQFQFLDPPKILLPVSELPVSVFRPPQTLLLVSVFRPLPKYCCQFQNCQF